MGYADGPGAYVGGGTLAVTGAASATLGALGFVLVLIGLVLITVVAAVVRRRFRAGIAASEVASGINLLDTP